MIEAMGEGSFDFDSYKVPSESALCAMRAASPIAYIDNVRTPTMICLGLKDRRVPPSQGLEYFHLLRAKNVPSRLLTFPDDIHAIDKPASEAEHWIAIAEWMRKYL
jgi:acylaminoacyl-peptidase